MDFQLPEIGEGVYEAEVTRWLIQPGATVKHGQSLVEVLTDKATMEVPSPFAGVVDKLLIQEGQKAKVGQTLLSYTGAGQARTATEKPTQKTGEAPKAAPAATPMSATPMSTPAHVQAAPSVRQKARHLGVDLTQVHGSGPHGRILMDDLQAKNGSARSNGNSDSSKPGARVKLVGLRRKIAETMSLSKRTIPHYTYVDECDVTDLVKLRDQLKEPFAKQGVKLTYLAFVVKAVAEALREVPSVNATLDEEHEEIVTHASVNVGVAVASDAGLIVPVLRDADRKPLVEIAREIERLSNDARGGKLKLDDLRGGGYTVTSIGNLGGLFATPIIPPGQLGILGVGKIVKRPIFDALDQVVAAQMLYLSFSFDHRIIDGAVAVAFGNAVIKHLRSPGALLVE